MGWMGPTNRRVRVRKEIKMSKSIKKGGYDDNKRKKYR
jgi:hypothetical protein